MRIGIATDHGGFGLKEDLVVRLRAAGHEVFDFGAHDLKLVSEQSQRFRAPCTLLRPHGGVAP